MTSSKFRTMIFWKTFLHNVNKPNLKSLCKFQVDIPINARLDNLYAFVEANKQWFCVLIAVFEHGKVVYSTWENFRARDAVESPEGVGIGESLAYTNGVAMGWPLAYLWHIHGIPMTYLCNASVNSKHQHSPRATPRVLHSTAVPGRDLYLMTFPGDRVFAYP